MKSVFESRFLLEVCLRLTRNTQCICQWCWIFTEVHLLKYCTKEQLLGMKHFHVMPLYRPTPINLGGKYCIFYSITHFEHVNQLVLLKVKPPSSILRN